ncbi:uncharacterized protein LOC132552148 [Ylistrum balloti]|uniref:uncharacterized protein LOC132552148 n=1 Tax=Ylistrum balloti TaxID=509963 RepID=UPI002905C950|nr:uncharacterized protein LOC132552148 [Ylistrum balloti]
MNHKKMGKTGHQYLCAKKMVLKKYRKQRFGVRKKCLPSIPHILDPDTVNTKFKLQRQHIGRLQSHRTFSSSTRMEDETFTLSQLVTSSLSHTNVCSEFPISEIGSELSGNRGNGNSPFNSSNSCGSPESAVLQTSYVPRCSKQGQVSVTEGTVCNKLNDCDKCSLTPEQNNNLGTEGGCGCPSRNENTPIRDTEESIIDVVSLDEEESVVDEKDSVSQEKINNASNAFDLEECLDKRKPLSVDVSVAEQLSSSVPLPCKVNHQKTSRSSVSPVNWQQQFMSFLSTTPEPSFTDDAPLHLSTNKSQSHSSRKKRSRKVRSSMCPCCVGTSSHSIHGKRTKHHSGHSRKHSLSREHKHFIRDMVQLVSLRNKIVTLFCSIFPQCQEFIRSMNPDSEKVDLLIDQVVDILQTPEPFDIDHLESEKDDVKSLATYSDSGTDPVDLSEYPSLEKPDDIFFADKDSDDMPVLDDYSADDKTQDEEVSVSKGHSYSEDFLVFLEKTRANHEHQTLDQDTNMLDPGGNSLLLQSGPSEVFGKSDNKLFDLKNFNSAYSEGDSETQNDNSAQVRDCRDCCPKYFTEEGPNTDLGTSCYSKCNTNHKVGSCVISISGQADKSKTSELPGEKFQGSFQEFLNSSRKRDSNQEMHDSSCDEEEVENQATSFTSISSHQAIHLPAYSDISEASRMSSVSPFDWTGGVDTPLFGKQESKSSFSHRTESRTTKPDSKFCISDLHLGDADNAPDGDTASSAAVIDKDLSCDQSQSGVKQTKTIKIYESYVELCRKPKICLKALKHRLNALLTWLLPSANIGSAYFKSFDNLEYLLDVLIYCNTVNDDTNSLGKDRN